MSHPALLSLLLLAPLALALAAARALEIRSGAAPGLEVSASITGGRLVEQYSAGAPATPIVRSPRAARAARASA
jgi:hypothetical protein